MDFNPEEISLCKQIAERHIKKVKYGEWYLLNGKPILCAYANEGFHKSLEAENKIVPLWTISDCLDWLQEKVETVELWRTKSTKKWICRLRNGKWYKASVPLEACLKAVLAVLEEEK